MEAKTKETWQSKEIETLLKEHIEKYGNYFDFTETYSIGSVTLKRLIAKYADQQTAQLKTECERLREALQKIIKLPIDQVRDYVTTVDFIAITALNKTEQ